MEPFTAGAYEEPTGGRTSNLQPAIPQFKSSTALPIPSLPIIVPAGMQSVEIGVSIDTHDDCLAVDDEMLLTVLQRSLNDPREALRPVVPASGNQPHPIALALHPLIPKNEGCSKSRMNMSR